MAATPAVWGSFLRYGRRMKSFGRPGATFTAGGLTRRHASVVVATSPDFQVARNAREVGCEVEAGVTMESRVGFGGAEEDVRRLIGVIPAVAVVDDGPDHVTADRTEGDVAPLEPSREARGVAGDGDAD